jgi:hypothetical protein
VRLRTHGWSEPSNHDECSERRGADKGSLHGIILPYPTDRCRGVVVPSHICPGSQLSLTGLNRDGSLALATHSQAALIMRTSKQEKFRSAMTDGIETLNGSQANRRTG